MSSQASKVTGLYAELVKELELQMSELRKLLASREEAAVQQERRIKELELENQQLKSQLRNLEEENDLLSSRNGAGGSGVAAVRTVLGPGAGGIGNRVLLPLWLPWLACIAGCLQGVATSQASL